MELLFQNCFEEALPYRTQILHVPTAVLTQAFSGFNMPTVKRRVASYRLSHETLNENFVSCESQFCCFEKSINCTSWFLCASQSVITLSVLAHTDQYKIRQNRWI